MRNLKTMIQSALMSAALVFSNEALCTEDTDANKYTASSSSRENSSGATTVDLVKKVEHDFGALERDFPMLFSGFSATPFTLIEQFRSLNDSDPLQPMVGIREEMEALSTQLKIASQLTHIQKDLDERLLTSGPISCVEYIYYLARVALAQGTGTDDEEIFFKAAGFSMPYASIRQGDWAAKLSQKSVSSFQDFISLFKNVDSLKYDERGDFVRTRYCNYFDDEDIVRKAIQKGPFAKTAWPLPGKDILGFFYLAFTYAKGIHPIPIPFSDKSCVLHGIEMSRWAQVCHDLAHSNADAVNYNAEQFAHHFANHYVNLLRTGKGDDLTPDEREKYSIPEMLPHFINFSLSVHNLYQQSLVDILMLSLQEMDPRVEAHRPGFEAFCVAAFLQAHERPIDISRKYGTHNLSDLLSVGTPQESEAPVKNQGQADAGDIDLVPTYLDQEFETSFITGETQLTDKQIFDLVKLKPKSEFIKNHHYVFNVDTVINEKEIARYKVFKNKFYVEVEITLRDGEKRLFRKVTNYSSQMNFEHDLSILKAARTVLKKDYSYNLPKIPVIPYPLNTEAVKAYEQEALQCRLDLEQGFKNLLDIWAKCSRDLCRRTMSPFTSSISDRFESGYKAAYQDLAAFMPPFVGDLEHFIRDATKPPSLVVGKGS